LKFVDDEFNALKLMNRLDAIRLMLLLAAAKFADVVDEKLKDPARITKSSCRDPHGWRQLTRVNLANVLDEGLMIGERATIRDSGIEIGTRCT
jgi:hypothetical protein